MIVVGPPEPEMTVVSVTTRNIRTGRRRTWTAAELAAHPEVLDLIARIRRHPHPGEGGS